MARQKSKNSSKRNVPRNKSSPGGGGGGGGFTSSRSLRSPSKTSRTKWLKATSTWTTLKAPGRISSYGRTLRSNSSGQRSKGGKKTESSSSPKKQHRGECERKAPSVNSIPPPPPLTDDAKEKELRKFDLDPIFGPSRGITRQARLQRSLKLNLIPPYVVMSILEADKENGFQKCIWDQKLSC